MKAEGQLDPTSLVARIIAELQANPEAQRLLLRALLTNEFLGMPARLDRIEKDIAELKADVSELKADVSELKADVSELKADVSELKGDVSELKGDVSELKGDVSELKADVSELKADVSELKADVSELKGDVSELKGDVSELKTGVARLETDVAHLKGNDLENRLHRRIRALASRVLDLRRPRVVQSPVQETEREFADRVEEALDGGRITTDQEARIEATDFIMHAWRRTDQAPVWVAVEASNRVHAGDIQRARATADALRAAFAADAEAVVAGYAIDPPDADRAEAARVKYLEVSPARPN